MGVPGFFVGITNTYPKTIRPPPKCCNRLYLDCNSILYDVYNVIIKNAPQLIQSSEITDVIIRETIIKIKYYITMASPSQLVYIAFDGVAPFAKIDHQRNRRFKSAYQSMHLNKEEPSPSMFTSIAFTPGTTFMNSLSTAINAMTIDNNNQIRLIKSPSSDVGEGEHKLFEHMRQHPTKEDDVVFVYGLDADLIMLSLLHLQYCSKIFVYREAPHFMNGKQKVDENNNKMLSIDISMLSRCIISEMNCKYSDVRRMYDYVFMCFFMGNDFLPRFPALNIRSGGLQTLLDVYRTSFGMRENAFLVNGDILQNNNIKTLFDKLSRIEHELIMREYKAREHGVRPPMTEEAKFMDAPVIFRQQEMYIDPSMEGWESRYYDQLFVSPVVIKTVVDNYMDGLDWTWTYYTKGCSDWKWKYNYSYPPLLSDLHQYYDDKRIRMPIRITPPLTSRQQLVYVLPPSSYHLLPPMNPDLYATLIEKMGTVTLTNMTFKWAFCRYFWECHADLPEFPEIDMYK